MKLTLSKLDSPLGVLLLVTDEDQKVRALDFGDRKARLHRGLRESYGAHELHEGLAPADIAGKLVRYFDGDLTALEDLAVRTAGTELQERVWAALRKIPAGQTTSYGDVARKLGFTDPRAAIDIGAANGANPVAIIIPCHRVIARDGQLKGYAGGVHRKRWLLNHEGALPDGDLLDGALKSRGMAIQSRVPAAR